jgi:hypothetical protein
MEPKKTEKGRLARPIRKPEAKQARRMAIGRPHGEQSEFGTDDRICVIPLRRVGAHVLPDDVS